LNAILFKKSSFKSIRKALGEKKKTEKKSTRIPFKNKHDKAMPEIGHTPCQPTHAKRFSIRCNHECNDSEFPVIIHYKIR
jgi:hypothetical protein